MEEAKKLLPDLVYCSDAYETMEGADALILVTEWNEFRALDLGRVGRCCAHPLVVDLRNIYRAAGDGRGRPLLCQHRPAPPRAGRRAPNCGRSPDPSTSGTRRSLHELVVRKRVLVTGGAGFLGSHLCERLVARGDDVLCVDNYFTGRKDNIAASARRPAFRGDAPRHHPSALCRGRRDLQPRLPGLADPLPVRSRADHQDQRHRRDQHAGARQAAEGQDLPGLDLGGLRRPDPAPAARKPIAATSTRSGRAPATTRASAAPRPCSSTITASTAAHPRRPHLQHLRAAHAPQ